MPLVLLRAAPIRIDRVGPSPHIASRTRPMPLRLPVRPPVGTGTVEPCHGIHHRSGSGADGRIPAAVQSRCRRGRVGDNREGRSSGRTATSSRHSQVPEVQRQLQAGTCPSRLRHRQVHHQDGSFLSLGRQCHWNYESQGESSLGEEGGERRTRERRFDSSSDCEGDIIYPWHLHLSVWKFLIFRLLIETNVIILLPLRSLPALHMLVFFPFSSCSSSSSSSCTRS